jgi:hypothetical protein
MTLKRLKKRRMSEFIEQLCGIEPKKLETQTTRPREHIMFGILQSLNTIVRLLFGGEIDDQQTLVIRFVVVEISHQTCVEANVHTRCPELMTTLFSTIFPFHMHAPLSLAQTPFTLNPLH